MLLSIVIPTKNEEKRLPQLLDSIRRQTYRDFEVIVADAHSTDTTRACAVKGGAKVVDGGMPGPGRNRGAEAAQGEMIFFFDADVVLPSDTYLEACVQEMEARKFDIGTSLLFPFDGSRLDHVLHTLYNRYVVLTAPILAHAPGFCMLVRREVHHKIHGFDEEVVFAEDMDYVRRATSLGFHFGVLRGQKIHVSARRLRKEGRWALVAKYMYAEAHLLFKGPFKNKMPFSYEFEHKEDQKVRDTKK